MTDKPLTGDGYTQDQLTLVRRTCLYVATKLGDLMDDLVVVGGLVPSLLVDRENSGIPYEPHYEPHVGTMDLDLGLAVGLLNEGRYRRLTDRLRRAGFEQDRNPKGNPTRQRWKIEQVGRVAVDFLIPPTRPGDRGGALRDIEPDFAAIIAPGLNLAFRDRRRIRLSGKTLLEENATREIWVCGPGAYVVLKALAFRLRGENKDAYDLYYVVRNFGGGASDVAISFDSIRDEAEALQALAVIREDFLDPRGLAPRRVAQFLHKSRNDATQADVAGTFRDLVRRIDSGGGD